MVTTDRQQRSAAIAGLLSMNVRFSICSQLVATMIDVGNLSNLMCCTHTHGDRIVLEF